MSTEPSKIEVQCQLVNPRKISCEFAQVSVSKKSTPTKLAAEIASLRNELTTSKGKQEFVRACPEMVRQFRSNQARGVKMPAEAGAYIARMESACTAKDPEAFVQASEEYGRAVTIHSCDLSVNTFKQDFDRVDDNTWIRTGTQGICNASLVQTIWRKTAPPGKSKDLWRYRQVRTIPPNENGPLCAGLEKLSTLDFAWDTLDVFDMGCRYFDL